MLKEIGFNPPESSVNLSPTALKLMTARQFVEEEKLELAISILETMPENLTAQTWLQNLRSRSKPNKIQKLPSRKPPVYSEEDDEEFLREEELKRIEDENKDIADFFDQFGQYLNDD
jgi:hypothetical protein